MYNPYYTGTARRHPELPRSPTPDRQEIIKRIKGRTSTLQSQDQNQEPAMPHALPTPVLEPSPPNAPSLMLTESSNNDWATTALAIVRPGSALHKGDFHAKEPSWQDHTPIRHASTLLSTPDVTSPVAPWHEQFAKYYPTRQPDTLPYARRSTVSYSPSASFSYQPPTSPLVQQSNTADIPDDDELLISIPDMQRTYSEKRYTSSPLPYGDSYKPAFPEPYGRRASFVRDTSIPYKAHQPRLSIGSTDLDIRTMPRRPRRLSTSGARSSMVGSFEESILMGRMSSSPSVPVDFTAQIGVLGLGDCKRSLKCPPHITVPFPAVFYSYGSSTKSQPSPYVGMVDLENRTIASLKCKPRSTDVPPGSYRIPATGQLQVVIKNPHKTAVKLFLVPYDVSTMQPGQKTFIRQRSVLSDKTVIDMPLSALKSAAIEDIVTKPAIRPVMRYMIQLHICCTAKGRIYLHKNIRVVFANRVPDSTEKLHNDIQYPEPRYSPYKPLDPAPGLSDERLSKRRKSEVLPSRTREALRLTTRVFPDERGLQSADGRVMEEVETDTPWLSFTKRQVSRPMEDARDLGIACSPGSPKSTSESLLVNRLRDLEVRNLGMGLE